MLLKIKIIEAILGCYILKQLRNIQYKGNIVHFSFHSFRFREEVIGVFPNDTETDVTRIEIFDEKLRKLA